MLFISLLLLLLLAFSIRGRHSGFSISSCSYLLYPPPSHQLCHLHLRFLSFRQGHRLQSVAGITATLYTFHFTLTGTRLSQITPDILLHPFHPACTLFFTSLPQSPLIYTIEPIYLKPPPPNFRHLFSMHFHCAVNLPLIHTQVFCLSPIDF